MVLTGFAEVIDRRRQEAQERDVDCPEENCEWGEVRWYDLPPDEAGNVITIGRCDQCSSDCWICGVCGEALVAEYYNEHCDISYDMDRDRDTGVLGGMTIMPPDDED